MAKKRMLIKKIKSGHKLSIIPAGMTLTRPAKGQIRAKTKTGKIGVILRGFTEVRSKKAALRYMKRH